ncbi:MAG: hypothetical protein WEB88_18055 [Gemmatimonadota bacterium]
MGETDWIDLLSTVVGLALAALLLFATPIGRRWSGRWRAASRGVSAAGMALAMALGAALVSVPLHLLRFGAVLAPAQLVASLVFPLGIGVIVYYVHRGVRE